MHRSRIYSPRNGTILCHYLSARRAVNCAATNVVNYFKFGAFLLFLLAVASVCWCVVGTKERMEKWGMAN